jgi:hypothetical protein
MTPKRFFELHEILGSMRKISHSFYQSAFALGNHPFIEFTGIINEYIKECESCLSLGVDFTNCNAHSGHKFPLPTHSKLYIEEKLECIFQGSVSPSYEIESDYPDW